MKEDFKDKLNKLKKAKEENRVKYKWQDAVLYTMEELGLPRTLHSDKSKKPLNVTGVLMRHAKEDLTGFTRRFAIIKEKGLGGASAVKYYLGMVDPVSSRARAKGTSPSDRGAATTSGVEGENEDDVLK